MVKAGDTMYVGIDGGGTATRGILSNGHDVMLEAGAGPSNAIVVGEERAYEAVQKTWRALVEHPGTLIDATVIGLAGVDRPFLRDNWIRRLDQLIPGDYWLVGDYQLAWAALSHGDPGVVGILGTGSVFFGHNGVNGARVGGYGWQLGDSGSGIALGQKAVKATLAMLDGTGETTALGDLVSEYFQASTALDILTRWYTPPFEVRAISDLAQKVLQAAANDAVARALVDHEAQSVVNHYQTLTKGLGWRDRWPVGVMGGLSKWWLPWLNQYWLPLGYRTPLTLVTEKPVEGAVWLAQQWKNIGKRSDRHVIS